MGDDKSSSSREPRSSASGGRSGLSRCVTQHRAFVELARVVAAGPQGIWTAALPILLAPAGAVWGVAYRVTHGSIELIASEGLPLSLRISVEAFDLSKNGNFAACRAVRTRRAAGEDKVFASVLDARTAASFEAAGLRAGAAVPIAHGGVVYGVLVAGASGREMLDGESLMFLDASASLLAPALALADAARSAALDQRASVPPRSPVPKLQEVPAPPRLPQDSAKAPPPMPRSSDPPSARTVDVGRAAIEAVQQCTPFLRRLGIDVRLAVEEGHVALGEPGDIGFAIAHLVTNAAEAAAERSPGAQSPSQPRRLRVAVVREGAAIIVSVDDSGRGVPPDLRARVFEAGFSTKGKSRGTGLAAVRKIALSAGGHVEVASSELGGASFRLVLAATSLGPSRAPSGTWQTGATWPNIHASGREVRGAGDGGRGDKPDGDPAVLPFRRVSSR